MTIKQLLINIFGSYTPSLVSAELSDGSLTYVSAPDIPWIMSVLIFILFLYCIFRIIGGKH